MNYQKIYTSTDHMEIQKILDALSEENIPVYAKERGASQYFQIIGGMAFVEKEIYVGQEDAEKALLLIQYLTEPEPMEENEAENYVVPWYRKRSTLARISMSWAVVIFFIAIICAILFTT